MSHDFNLDGLLNYDDDQAVSPDTIISELGKQLEEATNGFVKGVVREYEGAIEFFLTAPKIENYKYRILFFEYGIGMYPVKIVLEQGIADEIFKKENANYIIEYETKNELENVIINILKTKKVIKVMQELIYATKRFERLDKKELKLVDKSSDENDE